MRPLAHSKLSTTPNASDSASKPALRSTFHQAKQIRTSTALFWQTATANTKADGSLEINATIDTIGYTITEASIRQEYDDVAPSQPSSSSPPVASTSSPPLVREREETLEGLLKKETCGCFRFRRSKIPECSREEKVPEDPLDSSVQGLVTPSTTKVDASGEEQVEDISPNTLEAAKTLSRSPAWKFQEEVDTGAEQVNTAEGVNTGSIKLSTGSEQISTGNEQVSTVSTKKSTPSPDKGQREGKAPMISEETPKKSKEHILQEEASLAEAIRLDSLQKEEEAKQIHLDSLFQFEAQHYTDEDWDLIRAKIEANAELSKSMLGSDLQGEDFAKKMVDLVNQRKKYFAEERARAKRNKL
ncbi:hypothetical protein Tco_0047526 [Tanacetum coccineum]